MGVRPTEKNQVWGDSFDSVSSVLNGRVAKMDLWKWRGSPHDKLELLHHILSFRVARTPALLNRDSTGCSHGWISFRLPMCIFWEFRVESQFTFSITTTLQVMRSVFLLLNLYAKLIRADLSYSLSCFPQMSEHLMYCKGDWFMNS